MNYELKLGDNAETLKQYPDNYFDSIVTDPPYGIAFLGKDWDNNTGAMETWEECYRVLKPGGHLLAFSAARTYHHLATNIEMTGFEIRDQLMWLYASGFPKAQDVGKAIERREGKRTSGTGGKWQNADGGNGTNTTTCSMCGKTNVQIGIAFNCENKDCEFIEKLKPADNEWAGWKTALKPAHEPIVMARKPFKGSCLDNVLEHGVGALNIDASRIESEPRMVLTRKEGHNATLTFDGSKESEHKDTSDAYEMVEHNGRFPSNVIGEVPDYQKYFYCPKVSRAERHVGCDDPGVLFPRPRKDTGEPAGDGESKVLYSNPDVKETIKNQGSGTNNHPTVKPVELMKYLVKLVTPAGGKVLDPFNGSGSTGMACVELGYEYVGCELDPEYLEIANKRISAWGEKHKGFTNLFTED